MESPENDDFFFSSSRFAIFFSKAKLSDYSFLALLEHTFFFRYCISHLSHLGYCRWSHALACLCCSPLVSIYVTVLTFVRARVCKWVRARDFNFKKILGCSLVSRPMLAKVQYKSTIHTCKIIIVMFIEVQHFVMSAQTPLGSSCPHTTDGWNGCCYKRCSLLPDPYYTNDGSCFDSNASDRSFDSCFVFFCRYPSMEEKRRCWPRSDVTFEDRRET